jgi:LCP family protein required for cell wall assembly
MADKEPKRAKRRGCGCLGCLGRLLIWIFPVLALSLATFLAAFFLFPPFGQQQVARVLLVGLDNREEGVSRSDTIMLLAARTDGSGTTLLSIPRDARVRIPQHRAYGKINAAYAEGQERLLQATLAQPSTLQADLPYYIVLDSDTVAAVIKALGGIDVDVPRDMNYDDNWAKLHIHLKKGPQHLNGAQVVGYLRWRKNNNGRGNSDDFDRTNRQRQLLVAMKSRILSWYGITHLPALYTAFRAHATTNMSFTQFIALAWAAHRQVITEAVPGAPRTIGGVSYVLCDWDKGRQIWEAATR